MSRIPHRSADSLCLTSRHTGVNWAGAEAEGRVGATLQALMREVAGLQHRAGHLPSASPRLPAAAQPRLLLSTGSLG